MSIIVKGYLDRTARLISATAMAATALACVEPAAETAFTENPPPGSEGYYLKNGDRVACDTATQQLVNNRSAIGGYWHYQHGVCTPTLVADQVILLAAHCLPNTNAPSIQLDGDTHWSGRSFDQVSQFILFANDECDSPQQDYVITEWVTFGRGSHDVALARIEPGDSWFPGDGRATQLPSAFGLSPFPMAVTAPAQNGTIELFGRGQPDSGSNPDFVLRTATNSYQGLEIEEHEDNFSSGSANGLGNLLGGDSGGPVLMNGSIHLVNESIEYYPGPGNPMPGLRIGPIGQEAYHIDRFAGLWLVHDLIVQGGGIGLPAVAQALDGDDMAAAQAQWEAFQAGLAQ